MRALTSALTGALTKALTVAVSGALQGFPRSPTGALQEGPESHVGGARESLQCDSDSGDSIGSKSVTQMFALSVRSVWPSEVATKSGRRRTY